MVQGFGAGLVFFLCLLLAGEQPKADMVTDSIGIQVGYIGMDFSDYVLVGDYHISEIEANLPIYEDVFSFFSSQDDPSKYTYVVDSARGFAVTDLLEYANIYYGDVYNLSFYVLDHNSIWASFDRDDLFSYNRYYFNNLPKHRKILYDTYLDEEGKEQTNYGRIIGYNFDEAWTDCNTVWPMLAIEDNWASFNEEFESAGPDFSYMNTSTRFRLLYGQYDPTYTDMQRSAKYTRWVYVTLYGKPEFGEMPELDGSYGSHTIETTISVHQELRDVISDFLNLYSTDESVLVIKGVTVTAVENYSDLSKVVIEYEIVGDGEASIGASFGSAGALQEVIAVPVDTIEYNRSKEVEKETGQEKDSSDPQEKDSSDPAENQEQPETQGTPMEEQPAEEILPIDQEMEAEVVEGLPVNPQMFVLSGDIEDELNAWNIIRDEEIISPVSPSEDITQVIIAEESEAEKNRRQMIMLLTGTGCLVIGGFGALSEYVGFKIRLKKH